MYQLCLFTKVVGNYRLYLYQIIVILHSLKASWRSYSHDVDNLTYLDGYCIFSVCELKEDSQFTVLWLYKNKGFLCFFAS